MNFESKYASSYVSQGSRADERAAQDSPYGFRTAAQSYAERRTATPAINPSTPRPDWLDDAGEDRTEDRAEDRTVDRADGAEVASKGEGPVTADSEAEANSTNKTADQTADKTGDETGEPAQPEDWNQVTDWNAQDDADPAVRTNGSTAASNGSSDSDWTQPDPSAADTSAADTVAADSVAADGVAADGVAATHAQSPKATKPTDLQWFVKDDAQDPWGDAHQDGDLDNGNLNGSIADDSATDSAHADVADNVTDDIADDAVDAGTGDAADTATPQMAGAQTAGAQTTGAQTTAIELDLYADRRYRAALERMQFAQWEETLLLLRAVERDYPQHPNVTALINEAELKAGVVGEWAEKLRPRRLTVRQEMIIRRAVPIMLLLLLFVGAAGFYRAFVQPSRQAVATTQAILNTLDEAQQLAYDGRYAESLALYDSVLATDPGNPLARQGRNEAERLYAVTTEYNLAMRVAQAGNYIRAAGLLENLVARAPGFRDAEAQLTQFNTRLQAQELFAEAEANYRLQRWPEAVQNYQALVQLDSEFETETVRAHLQDSYVQAGLALVTQWPAERSDVDLAQEYFRAAATRRSDATIQTELERLDRFFRGEQALERSDLREAINIWRSLYDEEPQYLGGYLADQLYRAYLNLANRAQQEGDLIYAKDLYQLALELDVQNTNDAQRALDQLQPQAAAPTPLPTSLSASAPTASATAVQVAAYSPPVAPPPQPTAVPTPTPAPDFTGWIAFRTSRNGGEEIWVMQPDGSQQQPAPPALRDSFQARIEAERRTPDGLKVLSVRTVEGQQTTSLFVTDLGLPADANRDFQLTHYNRDEYDPVWSPTDATIAFVSNHTGNDEIFTMHPDGSNLRQLTSNEWQWDKHPSFSPDGSQIAFYTNRTGPRQIFLMNNDGGGQWNISQNGYDDWDPVWLKN